MNDLIVHPSVVANRERIVEHGFWQKVRRTAGKVPFLQDAVAGYFCAMDPAAPAKVRASILAALAYFVVPTDLVPDFIAGLGYSDDAAVLYGVLKLVHHHITAEHKSRAAALLLRDPPPETAKDDA
ncbi:MAG TPA: YkvA family protein [Alphaproteobacteria bacterium]|nr:YkvA family protein [Alphaproteobacteria bacterium]